jgi:hypothetical protein
MTKMVWLLAHCWPKAGLLEGAFSIELNLSVGPLLRALCFLSFLLHIPAVFSFPSSACNDSACFP